ncbi:verprolin-like [Schistocerca piceifrons]|uniref:verprolin-like n=1 Tax=Schistocerca piceifrons TaxID=274613 RepID=UPI001F5E3B17|nr:verprolin-like [Schistocerca piceifrons]
MWQQRLADLQGDGERSSSVPDASGRTQPLLADSRAPGPAVITVRDGPMDRAPDAVAHAPPRRSAPVRNVWTQGKQVDRCARVPRRSVGEHPRPQSSAASDTHTTGAGRRPVLQVPAHGAHGTCLHERVSEVRGSARHAQVPQTTWYRKQVRELRRFTRCKLMQLQLPHGSSPPDLRSTPSGVCRLVGCPAPSPPPHPRPGGGCEPRRLAAATDQALASFRAASAVERAALQEELVAVHRQLQQLRDELRALTKTPPVPAAASPVSRPAGVDAATQTSAPSPPAAMQAVAPVETDALPPGHPPTAGTAASKGATAPSGSSPAEKPPRKVRRCLPIPGVPDLQPALKAIAAALQDGSWGIMDNPYPFTPPDQPKPLLPHRRYCFGHWRSIWEEVVTAKELAIINSHSVYTPRDWDTLSAVRKHG